MQTLGLIALVPLLLLPGCYLAHVAGGQAKLLWGRRPIAEVLADPDTPTAVRERLAGVEKARALAARLGLRVSGQYQSYADWPGDRLVTIVVATRPGELEPRGFWFPVVGRVPYKGFFSEARATAEADALRARGLDVCRVPVPAYSTLGWMDDPVTTPMLRLPEGQLVETVIHELVHATVFVESAAEFNEGVATFIGQEASVLFFRERFGAESPEATRERERVDQERRRARALGTLRARIATLYASSGPGAARDRARAALGAETRRELAIRGLGEAALNDACLALGATYEEALEAYRARLQELGGDLRAFVAAVRVAAEQPDPRVALLGARP